MQKLLIFFIFSLGIAHASSYKNLNNTEEMIFVTNIQGYQLSNTINLYQDNLSGQFYLPLTEFMNLLNFNIEYNDNGNIRGWFNNQQSKLEINLEKNKISVNRKDIPFDEDEVRVDNDELYLSLGLIEEMFGLTLDIDDKSLVLFITSSNLLPIETLVNKNKKRKNVANYKSKKEDPFILNERSFELPTLDFYNTTSRDFNQSINSTRNTSSVYTSGTALYLDYNLNYNNYYNSFSSSVNTTNIKFSKTLFNKKFYGIRYFAAGDIYSSSSASSSTRAGRGLYFSSNNDYSINQDKTVNIDGNLPDGWEVELYYNDQLIDYRNSAINNRFEFLNVPLFLGNNTFKLVYYGPFGEIKEEYRKYDLDKNLRVGEFSFSGSVLQNRRKVIENEYEYKSNSEMNKPTSNLNIGYGIVENLSLNLGLSSETQDTDYTKTNEYASIGGILSYQGISTEYSAIFANQTSNFAHSVSAFGNLFKSHSFYLSYDSFNDLKTSKSYLYNNYALSRLELRYSGSIYNVLNFFGGYEKIKYENNFYDIDKLYIRASKNLFKRNYITLESSYNKNNNFETNHIKGALSSGYKNISLRADHEHIIYPFIGSYRSSLTIDHKPSNINFYHFAKFSRYFSNSVTSSVNYYEYGISRATRIGKFSLSASSNFNQNHSVSLFYNVSLGYDKTLNKPFAKPEAFLTQNGNIASLVFIDNNNNGIYDEGDTPVENAKIKVNSSLYSEKSNKDGSLYTSGLATYTNSTVSLDADSLEDIMLLPKKDKHQVILKPGVVENLEFPLVLSGAIEGSVINYSKDLGFASVEIYDLNGNMLDFTEVDRDGSFTFNNIPYGNYIIKIKEIGHVVATEQIEINDYLTYFS